MDEETQRQVESTVLEILESADMERTTEYQVRSMASDRLQLDLSVPDRKRFVRKVVESFLTAQQQRQPEEEEHQKKQADEDVAEEEEGEEKGKGKQRHQHQQQEEEEYDDEGGLIICHLSNRRRVTIQEFRGRMLVSIREYYERDGKMLPSSKGISLTAEQWRAVSAAVPDIEAAIAKLK